MLRRPSEAFQILYDFNQTNLLLGFVARTLVLLLSAYTNEIFVKFVADSFQTSQLQFRNFHLKKNYYLDFTLQEFYEPYLSD